ncbi:gamma-butyrobetaine dioxygenase-like isoform X3 [Panulirus ornatus]|uniref:gamma-butyrobetaine dioxygenase-like isoform X3 n=1 Tax=Panulirus ornatus TaxID=150431 RepID=UPI003A8C094B
MKSSLVLGKCSKSEAMQAVRGLCLMGVARHSLRWWNCYSSGFQAISVSFTSLTSSRSYCMSKHGGKNMWPDKEVNMVKEVGRVCGKQQTVKSIPAVTVADVTLNHNKGMLEVSWGEGKPDIFPYVWLRDNCRCPSCFHAPSNSRTHLIDNLDLNTQPTSVQVLSEGKEVEVVWNDGHRGTYLAAWLHLRAFNTIQRHAKAKRLRLSRSYWGAKALEDLPQASFGDLLIDDTALMVWLQQLEVYGFVIVNGAPTKPGQVRKLAERIGFIKKTHYGEDFTVKAKPDPSNVAYLSGLLQLHTDLPYYEYKPGVQFIHCIVQYEGNGGESLVSDAVHVAQELKKLYPEKYHILTQTPVDWFDIGTDEVGEFYKIMHKPVICTDDTGEICRINMSQPQRDSFFSVPPEIVASWYDAMVTYHRLLSHPHYCLQFKMIPGTILTFDNLRIVHGRTGYMSGGGERHVEGCYIDWDEVRSRRRVLEVKLEITKDRLH